MRVTYYNNACKYFGSYSKFSENVKHVITKLYYRSRNNRGIVPEVANLGEIEGAACLPAS